MALQVESLKREKEILQRQLGLSEKRLEGTQKEM